jgi:hypothetical protein
MADLSSQSRLSIMGQLARQTGYFHSGQFTLDRAYRNRLVTSRSVPNHAIAAQSKSGNKSDFLF